MITSKKTNVKQQAIVHPESGIVRHIDATIYTAVKKAILQTLKGGRAIPFTQLSKEAAILVRKSLPDFKGSIPWYTITVRLDLETKGIVETVTVKGQKMNRLRK